MNYRYLMSNCRIVDAKAKKLEQIRKKTRSAMVEQICFRQKKVSETLSALSAHLFRWKCLNLFFEVIFARLK